MVLYLPRSEWNARPPEGSRMLNPDVVINNAMHWPGMPKAINAIGEAGKARIASALRGWQRYHMDVRGWSDIAYCMGFDQAGRIWTLRGINIRSGANGDATVNSQNGAFLLILGPGEQPTAAMQRSVKQAQADFCRRFRRAPDRPTTHSKVRPAGTRCPGEEAIKAVAAGKFDADATPTTPTIPPTKPPEGDSMSAADVQNLKDWIEKDYMPRLYNADKNGTAGKNHQEIEALLRALIRQEADRYKVYYGNLRSILAAVAADDANDVTQADVDQILAKFDECKPAEPPEAAKTAEVPK